MAIAPVFGFGNFITLICITVGFDVPLYVFAPLLAAAGPVFTGKLFRDRQVPTDMSVKYFRSQEALTSQYILWEQIKLICKNRGVPLRDEFVRRLDTLKTAAKK